MPILAPQRVELSDEAKQKILQSQNFAQFFDHAARIIEKAICEEDYAFDYGAIKDENEGLDTYFVFLISFRR